MPGNLCSPSGPRSIVPIQQKCRENPSLFRDNRTSGPEKPCCWSTTTCGGRLLKLYHYVGWVNLKKPKPGWCRVKHQGGEPNNPLIFKPKIAMFPVAEWPGGDFAASCAPFLPVRAPRPIAGLRGGSPLGPAGRPATPGASYYNHSPSLPTPGHRPITQPDTARLTARRGHARALSGPAGSPRMPGGAHRQTPQTSHP